jgi:hypothetical protein
MMQFTRRNFIKTTASGLVATILNPTYLLASTKNPYDTSHYFSKISDEELMYLAILGETASRLASKEDPEDKEPAMIAYAMTNRIGTWMGKNLRDVLLKNGFSKDKNGKIRRDENGIPKLYHQFSCFNKWDPNLEKMLNPTKHYPEEIIKKAKLVTRRVSENKLPYLNKGQNHYHTENTNPNWSKSPRMQKVWTPDYFKHILYKDTKA